MPWKKFPLQKLKKEIKIVRKHKETEIKRLNKENKQKEEEMKALADTLKLKEVALDTLGELLENQMMQIKELELKVKERSYESLRPQVCQKWWVELMKVLFYLN